jgi:hypothetical protein
MAIRSPFLHTKIMETFIHLATILTDDSQRSKFLSALIANNQLALSAKPVVLPLNIPTASLIHLTDTEILAQTLAPAAIQKTGLFDNQAIQTLRQRAKQQKKAPAELIFVFTTQLLATLFDSEGWA